MGGEYTEMRVRYNGGGEEGGRRGGVIADLHNAALVIGLLLEHIQLREHRNTLQIHRDGPAHV